MSVCAKRDVLLVSVEAALMMVVPHFAVVVNPTDIDNNIACVVSIAGARPHHNAILETRQELQHANSKCLVAVEPTRVRADGHRVGGSIEGGHNRGRRQVRLKRVVAAGIERAPGGEVGGARERRGGRFVRERGHVTANTAGVAAQVSYHSVVSRHESYLWGTSL